MKSQIVISGVGGQGVLFIAGIFTEAARRKGLKILGAENHGMSQRGGSVTSHLKIGDFESPLVAEGDADLLIGLEATETLRTLAYLHEKDERGPALCLVSVTGAKPFPGEKIAGELKRMGVELHGCAADEAALNSGNIRAANLFLVGFGSSLPGFPFTFEELRDALDALSAPRQKRANLEALELGRSLKDQLAA